MIYTCNFSNWKSIPGNIYPICIDREVPNKWSGGMYPDLYQTNQLLFESKRFSLNREIWDDIYRKEVLDKLVPWQVVEDFYNLFEHEEYDGCVLLTYVCQEARCHRHLVREWLINAGIDCVECTGSRISK